MKKERFTQWSMLWYFLRGSKKYFIFTIVSAILLTALDMLTPRVISFTIDSVLGSEPARLPGFLIRIIASVGGIEGLRDGLWMIAVTVCVIGFLNVLGKYCNMYFNRRGAETLQLRMRTKLYSHISTLPYEWHTRNQTGDIIQRCTSDVDRVRNFVAEQLTSVFRIVILVAFAMGSMYGINVKLAVISTCSIPVILLYSSVFRKKIGDLFEQCDENEGKLSAIAQENLTGVRVVRAFGREAYERDKFNAQNEKYVSILTKLNNLFSLFWSSGDLISGIEIMLVVTLGAVFCVRGELSTGDYIAIVSYNAMMTWPVRQLGRVISEMSKAGVSIGRIRYIMNSESEANCESPVCPDMSGDIEFRNVTYSFDQSAPVIDDVSFTIPGGKVFGILGATGSGKSTVINLLDRLLELQQGSITVGGVDIRDIDRAWLRSNIGIVLQEPFLFSGTIEENIALAGDSFDLEDVRRAARVACLDDAVMGFAKGYDTVVGERGITLSGGQKQRTAIARMIISHTPIMILDDSLSAVDSQTDARIRSALQHEFKDATVIIISHRLTTLMQADNILVLDSGRVSELGTHSQLMARDGIYKRIYSLQTADNSGQK